ncbi:MAG: transglycosylase SLT domain-containing protein [Niameybacter sp.]|uniref:lytic transglycosylase domain-containing protein n=1 Tax=Niameybacter sp. TaxID=2033640 RepID=UPI002FC8952B
MKVRRYLKVLICGLLVICIGVATPFVLLRRPYREWVESYSETYGVDSLLVYAVMKAESDYDPKALSRSGAKGLMQIMNKTGSWGATECEIPNYSSDQLFDPEINIQIGCWYLAKLMNQYEGDQNLALAAYNAGSGNVAKWRANTLYSKDGRVLHTIPFKETDKYVQKVSFYYTLYRLLYSH